MKQKYAVYGAELRRKMTVIDGRLFYESSGVKSGTPKRWLRGLMIFGTRKIVAEFLPPEIDGSTLIQDLERCLDLGFIDSGYIIKAQAAVLNKNIPAEARVSSKSSKDICERLPFKRDLITAYRLNSSSFTEQDLIDADLTAEEIQLAKQPIVLADKPVKFFGIDEGDKLNDWLLGEGLIYIGQAVQRFPDSYTKIWERAKQASLQPESKVSDAADLRESKIHAISLKEVKLSKPDDKVNQSHDPHLPGAKALFLDYTKGWFFCHGGRNHRDEVAEELVRSHPTAGALISAIRRNIKAKGKMIDPDGSLSDRMLYCRSRRNAVE